MREEVVHWSNNRQEEEEEGGRCGNREGKGEGEEQGGLGERP